jgi:hypothetical protein
VTTPDTSAVRAWAKDNGYEVADRGRLPAEITDAYLAAHDGNRKKAATAPAKKAAPATKAAPAKKAAPARRPGTTAVKDVLKEAPVDAPAAVIEREVVPAAPAPKPAAPATKGSPKPSPVSDDRRLVALGEEIAALAKRVEALEKSSGGSKTGAKGSARFLRRS